MEHKAAQQLFGKLYRENIDPLFRFVIFRVSDKDEAIDIAEDAFVRLWSELQKSEVKEPRALLFKITRNLIIDWYRKVKSVPMQPFASGLDDEEEMAIDMFASPLLDAPSLYDAKSVIEAISKLPSIYREAVYLRYVEELAPREIAEIIGQTPNVISVRINRGIEELKLSLHIN